MEPRSTQQQVEMPLEKLSRVDFRVFAGVIVEGHCTMQRDALLV